MIPSPVPRLHRLRTRFRFRFQDCTCLELDSDSETIPRVSVFRFRDERTGNFCNTYKSQCTNLEKFFFDNRTYYAKQHNTIKVNTVKTRGKPTFKQLSEEREWVYTLSRHLTLLSNVCSLSWYPQSLDQGRSLRVYSSEPKGAELGI